MVMVGEVVVVVMMGGKKRRNDGDEGGGNLREGGGGGFGDCGGNRDGDILSDGGRSAINGGRRM